MYSNAIFDDVEGVEEGLFEGEQANALLAAMGGAKSPSPPGSTQLNTSSNAKPQLNSPPADLKRNRSLPTISDDMPTDTTFEAVQDEDRYENSYSTWGLISDHSDSGKSSDSY